MIKGQTMALRINVIWYNGLIFRQQTPILCEKTGLLQLAIVGFIADWQTKDGWILKSWISFTG